MSEHDLEIPVPVSFHLTGTSTNATAPGHPVIDIRSAQVLHLASLVLHTTAIRCCEAGVEASNVGITS